MVGPYGCDLEKEEKLDRPYRTRLKPAKPREMIEGSYMIGKRPRGRKLLGRPMLNEFLKESSFAKLKRRAENRNGWRIWKPRTCLMAEH